MAKRRAAREPSDVPKVDPANEPVSDERNSTDDDSPELRSAAEVVRLAEAELKQAKSTYDRIRREATDRLKEVRQTTLGDLVDGVLRQVKKHPGPGVIVAIVAGIFLGRIFRR